MASKSIKNDSFKFRFEREEEYRKVPVDVANDVILRRMCPSVEAIYHDGDLELKENSDNPLILALPRFETRERFSKAMQMSFTVPHSDDARKLSSQLRLLGIERISRVLTLTDSHLQLLDWIHISLRHRYRGLVPVRALRSIAQRNYRETQRGRPRAIYTPESSHADCISVLGISGAGKTTMIKMVLCMFPMIIEHTEFCGIKARFVQIVWMMVSCPPNGSVLTLLKGILYWFDENLDTHYVEEAGSRANSGDLIKFIVDKIKLHHVGMLIIDEIQFAVQSADRADLMGFITSLLNDGQCLFVLVGTPDAGEVIKETIRNLRRVVSRTYIPLEHFPEPKDAKRLASSIVAIDFMPEKPDNMDEITATLIDVGASSPAFMKLAWEHTQYMGEQAGAKKVTPALVKSAVRKPFSLIRGLLEALRNKDVVALDGYRDVAEEQMIAIRKKIALEPMHWRRSHQLAGVAFCVWHGELLWEWEFANPGLGFVSPSPDLGKPIPFKISEKQRAALLQVAKISCDLLNGKISLDPKIFFKYFEEYIRSKSAYLGGIRRDQCLTRVVENAFGRSYVDSHSLDLSMRYFRPRIGTGGVFALRFVAAATLVLLIESDAELIANLNFADLYGGVSPESVRPRSDWARSRSLPSCECPSTLAEHGSGHFIENWSWLRGSCRGRCSCGMRVMYRDVPNAAPAVCVTRWGGLYKKEVKRLGARGMKISKIASRLLMPERSVEKILIDAGVLLPRRLRNKVR